MTPDEDLVKEIHGATIPRVDAVDGPAHGLPFMILKALDPTLTKAADMDDDLTAPADELMDAADDDAATADAVPSESPGDPDDPGSPAWEAVDAARARGAVAQLSALKDLLCEMAEREEQEAVSGHPGDADDALDLASAKEAVDYALSILAKFAVDEQSSADNGAQDAEDAARALGLIKALEDSESPVAKAGRVLSAKNEQTLTTAREAMTSAVEAITTVLGQVAPVEKQEAAMADENTEVVTKADDLSGTSEADLKRQVLTGSTSERNAALMELGLRFMTGSAGATGAPEPDADDTSDDTSDSADSSDAGADDSVAADVSQDGTTEQPSADTTPAAAPAAPTDDQADATVAKALEDPDKTDGDSTIAKALSDAMTKIAQLEERLVKVENTPVDDGPFMAGMTPGAPALAPRGQDSESDHLAGLRKQLEETTDPTARAALQATLATESIKAAWQR